MVLLNLGVRDVVSKIVVATIAVGVIVIITQTLSESSHLEEEEEQSTTCCASDLPSEHKYFDAQVPGPLAHNEGPRDDALRQRFLIEASSNHQMLGTEGNDSLTSEESTYVRRVRIRHRTAPSRRRRLGPVRRLNRAVAVWPRSRPRNRAPSYSTTDTESSEGISNERRGLIPRSIAIREHFERRNAAKALKRALLLDHEKDIGVTHEADGKQEFLPTRRGQQYTRRFIDAINQEQVSSAAETTVLEVFPAEEFYPMPRLNRQIKCADHLNTILHESNIDGYRRPEMTRRENREVASNQEESECNTTDSSQPLRRACERLVAFMKAQDQEAIAAAWARWFKHTRQLRLAQQSVIRCQQFWRRYACEKKQTRVQETIASSSCVDLSVQCDPSISSMKITRITTQQSQRDRAGGKISQFVKEKLIQWRRRCLHQQIDKRRSWRRRQIEREELLRQRLHAALRSRGEEIDGLLLAAELKKWVSSVMIQLHVHNTELPSCAPGSSCWRTHVDWFKFSGERNHRRYQRKLRGRLLERARKQSRIVVASTLQVVLRCRFALRLVGAKRRYLHGIAWCPELLGLGLHTRAAVIIQAAWRFSQSRQRWRQFVLVGKLRLLLLASAAQQRR